MKDKTKRRFWILTIAGTILTAVSLWLMGRPLLLESWFFIVGTSRWLRLEIYLNLALFSGITLIVLAFADRFIKVRWNRWLPKGYWLIALVLLLFVASRAWMLYQASILAGGMGFPIDDAWIHLTFAQNIAHGYDISFNPGELSTGSSAPLWTYMLAGGLALGMSPIVVSFVLGMIFSLLLLLFSYQLARQLWQSDSVATLVVLLLALEHYTAWDTLSGMEISLYTALVIAILWLAQRGGWRWWVAMALLGIALMTRVETIFLAGAIFLWQLWRTRGKGWFGVLAGGIVMLAVASPVILKYMSISGQILPQTYSAKVSPLNVQTLYIALVCTGAFLTFPTVLPITLGFIPAVRGWIREKVKGRGFVPVILFLLVSYAAYFVKMGFLGSYYRYLHPYIPLLAIFVVGGIFALQTAWRRVIITFALVVMLGASYLSAPLYGWSVENINNQQVTMAKWAAQNIPAGEKIAVNDVGAVGYFSNHYIVDLLGLVGDTSQRPDRFAITVDDLLKETSAI